MRRVRRAQGRAIRLATLLIGVAVFLPGSGNAAPGWPTGRLGGLDILFDAEVICAGTFEGASRQLSGRVEWRAPAGWIARPEPRVATFRVDHVIKGDLRLEGRLIEVLYVASLPLAPTVRARRGRATDFPDLAQKLGKRRCLLQLLSHEDGTWEIRFGGDSYMVLGAKPEVADWADLTDWQRLEREFVSAVCDPQREVAARAIASATVQDSPAAGPLLVRALLERRAGDDPWLRLLAVCGLVRINHLDTIYDLDEILRQPGMGDPSIHMYPEPLASVSDAIAKIRTRNSVPALVEYSQDSRRWLRAGATFALRRIGGRDAKAALAARLNDEDPMIRYDAVMGLGNGLKPRDVGAKDWKGWLPAAHIYDKDPEKVLNNWRRWWQERGKAKYPSVEQVLKKAERFRRERPWAREAKPQE